MIDKEADDWVYSTRAGIEKYSGVMGLDEKTINDKAGTGLPVTTP